MAKLRQFFISLSTATVLLTAPSLAMRDEESSTEGASLGDDIANWAKSAQAKGQEGQAAAELVVNLESGVPHSAATFTGAADALTLEVVHLKVNQGEIATLSKVPILWTLEIRVKYILLINESPMALKVEGIKLLPFPEGLQMYKDYKQSVVATEADCSTNNPNNLVAEVQCDRKALFKWYESQYKAKWSKNEYLSFESHPDHKLGRILIGMYGSWMTHKAINTKSGAWEKIIYSLVTIPPTQIDKFTFQSTSKKYQEVDMAMVAHPVFEGRYGCDEGVCLDLSEFQGLNFEGKNRAEFNKNDFQSQRSQAESFARSGINFGAMVAKGKDPTIQGGTAEYILKFAKPCTPAKKDKGKYGDPTSTDACKDKKGRVFWH